MWGQLSMLTFAQENIGWVSCVGPETARMEKFLTNSKLAIFHQLPLHIGGLIKSPLALIASNGVSASGSGFVLSKITA